MTISGAVGGFAASPALIFLSPPGVIPVASDSALHLVLSLGIAGVSISNWFGDDDEGDDGGNDESIDDAIDAAFEEAVGGGQEPADSDDLGDPAGDGEWDDFDGFDDEGIDDADGTVPSDLESRVDELEDEVASVSSTMSTVRSENEEISETVEEVEENVRKLLDVYEMVTQGVNPFVDEVRQEGGDVGAFDLFDGDDEPTDGEEPPDDDPDGFEFGDAGDAGGDDGEDGMTFEELKAEYEAGDADRADDGPGDGVDDRGSGETSGSEEPAAEPTADTVDDDPAEDMGTPAGAAPDGSGDKPYLLSLPDGYGAELLVMEWLEYLLGNSDVAETLQAIRYYQNVGWISGEVADDLRTILGGFDRGHGAGAARTDGSGLSQLTIEHHETSLAYINRLTGGEFRQRSFEMGGGDRGV